MLRETGRVKKINPHRRVTDGDFGVFARYATLPDHHDAAGGGVADLDEVCAAGRDVET